MASEQGVLIGRIVVEHWMSPEGDDVLTVTSSDDMTMFQKIGMLEMAKPYLIDPDSEDDE